MATDKYDTSLEQTGTVDQELPVWIRPPTSGREHYTGLSRAMLYQLAKEKKIRTSCLGGPGAKGTRLFHLRSVLDHIEAKEVACTS